MIQRREDVAEICSKSGIPEHMCEGLERYLFDGIEPGSFLRAVLENDFLEAVGLADRLNQQSLVEWARLIYNDLPKHCHGSPEAVKDWLDSFKNKAD